MSGLADAALRASARDLPRGELAAAVRARLEALGAPAASLAAAERIAARGSVVVVAGQQPALFGGPSLVWAKALDAIATARYLESAMRLPAAAVFWNASEDHDHAEADHVRMELGAGVETLRVRLPGDRRMLARVPVPEEARALLERLRAELPEGPSRDDVLAALEPAPGDAFGAWCSRILLRLLGPMGLVVVEPETIRPFAGAVLDEELARPGRLAASVRRAEDAAAARGEPRVLELARDALFFLVDDDGRRVRVVREDDAWRAEDGRVLTDAELRALPPSRFSWNVAARVLAQDAALPVAAQVCGPTEIRYCERLAEAHAELGLAPPALVPRTSWTFLSPRAQRLAAELGVDPLLLDEAPRPEPAEHADVARLREIVGSLPQGGSGAVQRRRSSLANAVEAYAEALRRDATERDAVAAARRARLLELMRPEREPQDRRLSPLPWLARAGLGVLGERLSEQASAPPADRGAPRAWVIRV